VTGGHFGAREPIDRVTRIADRMLDACAADPEHSESIRVIVMIRDNLRAELAYAGYGDGNEMAADLLVYLKEVFAANGRELVVKTLGRDS
jgi:hypothetical protein